MSGQCVFCHIVGDEEAGYKLFEDDQTLAMLDVYPLAVGHTLVIPKAHIERFEDMDPEVAKALFATVQRLIHPILRSVDAHASTIGLNNGREAGQIVPHVHIHIVPRFRGDGGGTIHSIMSRRPRVDADKMREVSEKIRSEVRRTE